MSFDLQRYSGRDEQSFIVATGHLILLLEQRTSALSGKATRLAEFQRNCCRYLLGQIGRLLKNHNYKLGTMEELASTCRNIFELLLTVKYYGALEEDAEVYLSQTEVDRNLVHEGILEWLRATNPESPGVLALSHIETTKDKGLKPPPRPNAKQMAQQANMVVEYDGFYKFYSKYIHPSAWSVNSRPEQLEHEGYREMLVFQCITYGTQTATLLGALRNLGSSAQTVLESPDPLNAKNQTDGKARGCSS